MSLRMFAAVLLLAAASGVSADSIDPPAAPGAFAPHLLATDDGALASWIEADDGVARVRVAPFATEGWREPATVVESDRLFANWADTPGVARAGDGAWLVWWLERLGEEPYAYGARLARSRDGGASWEALGWLHDDTSATEHGFVSIVPEGAGARAFWLDGRGTPAGAPMSLRSARIDAAVGASTLVDPGVCDCCPTAALEIDEGALVVYRDRSLEEVRDILRARIAADGGVETSGPVAADGWRIEGCPVNGPAIARAGDRVAVAWFTAPGDRARVSVAFGDGAGEGFAPPIVVDDEQPIGRVGLAPLADGEVALVWLARAAERAEVRLARVAPDGIRRVLTLAATSGGRRSGVPRVVGLPDGRLLVLWTEDDEGATRLRARRVAPAELADG
jgi:hypothetical protein